MMKLIKFLFWALVVFIIFVVVDVEATVGWVVSVLTAVQDFGP